MAENVQPDVGEGREVSSSGLLISTDPLQDSAGYKLSADDGDADSSDNGDSDNGDSDSSDDSDAGGPLVVEVGPSDSDSSDSDNGDSDNGDSDA